MQHAVQSHRAVPGVNVEILGMQARQGRPQAWISCDGRARGHASDGPVFGGDSTKIGTVGGSEGIY